MSKNEEEYRRLGDKVLEALELAVEQEDIAISDMLSGVLELSLTRNAGGEGFVERREFSKEIKKALSGLSDLHKKAKTA